MTKWITFCRSKFLDGLIWAFNRANDKEDLPQLCKFDEIGHEARFSYKQIAKEILITLGCHFWVFFIREFLIFCKWRMALIAFDLQISNSRITWNSDFAYVNFLRANIE